VSQDINTIEINVKIFNKLEFLLEKIKYRIANEEYNREVNSSNCPFYTFSIKNIILYDFIKDADNEIIGSIEKENRDYMQNHFCNNNYIYLKEYFNEIDNLFKEIYYNKNIG